MDPAWILHLPAWKLSKEFPKSCCSVMNSASVRQNWSGNACVKLNLLFFRFQGLQTGMHISCLFRAGAF